MGNHRFTIKELKEKSDLEIIQMIINERKNNLSNPYAPLYERLNKISVNLEKQRGVENLSLADYVTEVTVEDPDTKGTVEVSIYKDRESGGMFGIDSSFIEQMDLTHIQSPFNPEKRIELTGD